MSALVMLTVAIPCFVTDDQRERVFAGAAGVGLLPTAESGDLMSQRSGVSEPREDAPTDAFEQVGDIIGQMLALAQAEAQQIKDDARGEADQAIAEAHRQAALVKNAAGVAAAELVQSAERTAALLNQEVDEVRQRRIEQAEAALRSLTAQGEQAAEVLQARVTQVRRQQELAAQYEREIEAIRHEIDASRAKAGDLLANAQQHSQALVADATNSARQARSQVEAELAIAIERRDKIQAHLSELRELLAGVEVPRAARGQADERGGEKHGAAAPKGASVRANARRAAAGRPSPRYNWALAGARRGSGGG
jgi:hypothetical protein